MKHLLTGFFLGMALVSGNVMAQGNSQQQQTTNQVTDKRPLIILADGADTYKIESTAIKEIDSSWIDSVEVLKNAKTTERFGEAGKVGVVIITLKKEIEAANLYLENIKKSHKK